MAGVAFGAFDQYLGSLWVSNHVGYWTIDISGMSAPWLALPFLIGLRQPDGLRGAASGAGVTFAALVGYFAMTISNPFTYTGVAAAEVALGIALAAGAACAAARRSGRLVRGD